MLQQDGLPDVVQSGEAAIAQEEFALKNDVRRAYYELAAAQCRGDFVQIAVCKKAEFNYLSVLLGQLTDDKPQSN